MTNERFVESDINSYQVDGKHLASRVNPVAEAQRWVARIRPSLTGPVAPIVVVGLGCGHHISALRCNFPNHKIFVFETRSEIIDLFYLRRLKEPLLQSHITVFRYPSLVEESNLQKLVSGLHYFLRHPCSKIYDVDIFDQAQAQLLGREIESFRRQLAWRSKSNSEALPRVDPLLLVSSNEAITIKSLFGFVKSGTNFKAKSTKLICALRELVT